MPKSFNIQDAAMSDMMRTMLKQIREFSRGIRTIPNRMEGIISDVDEYAFDSDERRDKIGPAPSPIAVAKIVRLASRCAERGHSEASWNSRVHSTLFDLALDNDAYLGVLDFVNW